MESNLPTRPTSDLRLRLRGRRRPPFSLHTQYHQRPGPVLRLQNRSPSLTSFSQSLSRLLPSNRKERGGTRRDYLDEAQATEDAMSLLVEANKGFGKDSNTCQIESELEDRRRTRSWSPKKRAPTTEGSGNSPSSLSRLRKPGTWKKLWELHNVVKISDGDNQLAQYRNQLRSADEIAGRAEGEIFDNHSASMDLSKKLRSHCSDLPTKLEGTPRDILQVSQAKRARREQRRSFRESGDFLGIQGANPRTGFPDPGTATSSSIGDIVSEPTRQKLEDDEKMMESASREYQAALERRQREMRRLEMERDRRRRDKKEKAERKKTELRARMRREGHWKSEGNKWRMVTEPLLTPIVQSTTGSPIHAEMHPKNQVKSMLAVADRSFPNLTVQTRNDYFGSPILSPSTPRESHETDVQPTCKTPLSIKSKVPYVEPAPSTPTKKKYRLPYDELVTASHYQSRLPVNSARLPPKNQGTFAQATRHSPLLIPRKEVGSPAGQQRTSSSETIIHNDPCVDPLPAEVPDTSEPVLPLTTIESAPVADGTTPGEAIPIIPVKSPSVNQEPFLDMQPDPREVKESPQKEATATSYQLTLKNQILTPRPSQKNQRDMSQAKPIISPGDFPPIILKDPLTARIPSNSQCQVPQNSEQIMDARTSILQVEQWSQASIIITPIITTIGLDPLPHRQDQLDGGSDTSEAQVSPHRVIEVSSKIPTGSLHQKATDYTVQSATVPPNTGCTLESSTRRPSTPTTPTKRPVPRLCQAVPTHTGKAAKGTPIFTSTSPQLDFPAVSQNQTTAQRAARTAFSDTSPHRLGSAVRARCVSLVSPRSRPQAMEGGRGRGRKVFSGGNADTEDRFRSRSEMEKNAGLLKKWKAPAKIEGGVPGTVGEGGTVAWNPPRKAEGGAKPTPRGKEREKGQEMQRLPSKAPGGPAKAPPKMSLLERAYGMARELAQTAWWFVSPVFNPRSGLRWRWVRNELTWQDIILIGVAGIFGGGAFVIVVLCARVLGMGLQIVRVVVSLCKVLVGA